MTMFVYYRLTVQQNVGPVLCLNVQRLWKWVELADLGSVEDDRLLRGDGRLPMILPLAETRYCFAVASCCGDHYRD